MSLKQEGDQIWTGHVLKCQPLSKEAWAAVKPVPAGRAARVLTRTRQMNKNKCVSSVPELEKPSLYAAGSSCRRGSPVGVGVGPS